MKEKGGTISAVDDGIGEVADQTQASFWSTFGRLMAVGLSCQGDWWLECEFMQADVCGESVI